MRVNETSVTFHIDKALLKEFEMAMRKKSEEIGVPLNKKQALTLAMKEAIDKWKKENPAE